MSDRIAIVTGGTRGLGFAISQALATEGLHVFMVYRRNTGAAEEALSQITKSGGQASIHQVDVGEPAQVAAFVSQTVSQHGGIDVLVHSAFRSGRPAAKTHELDIEAWQEDLATNLTGAFIVSRACLSSMLERKSGRIIFIGSLAARGERGRVAYTVAKNGVVGLAKTIAQEYARDGITANVVSPGYIDAGAFVSLDEKVKTAAAKQVPQRRLGTASEVAKAVVYFASEDSAYTTGQVLNVNGGVFSS